MNQLKGQIDFPYEPERSSLRRRQARSLGERLKKEAMETRPETARTRNREWRFFGTCVHASHREPEIACDEVVAILCDPRGRFTFEPEVARDRLDSTWGRNLANTTIVVAGGRGACE